MNNVDKLVFYDGQVLEDKLFEQIERDVSVLDSAKKSKLLGLRYRHRQISTIC